MYAVNKSEYTQNERKLQRLTETNALHKDMFYRTRSPIA